MIFQNLIGQRFTRLLVIKRLPQPEGHYQTLWECLCDCGTTTIARSSQLKSKLKRSCGCLQKQQQSKKMFKHGLKIGRVHPFYTVWVNMKDRCLNPKSKNYKWYGGRGIKVSDSWLNFLNFKNDLYESYLEHRSKNHRTQLDRIDNNGPYQRENVRWATPSQNIRNRDNSRTYLNLGNYLGVAGKSKIKNRKNPMAVP